jgi:crossover junction endodeoxyribonuclease RuvC
MRVMGVDPGNAVTGFGVVERSPAPRLIAAGTIRPRASERGPVRLAAIYGRLIAAIDEHLPAALSLERSFVAINVQSAFRLGEARAMVMLAAAHRGLELFEYTPTDVKLTIAGHGRADKAQVKYMVGRTLEDEAVAGMADDAADALAVALCHLFRMKMPRSVTSAASLVRRPA